MHNPTTSFRGLAGRAQDRLDAWLHAFSTYGLPIFIGILSVIALTVWHGHYESGNPQPLEFRYVRDDGGQMSATEAMAALGTPAVSHLDTNRSEAPFWFGFTAPVVPPGGTAVVEFPSRHAIQMQCWDEKLSAVGRADRDGSHGAMSMVKAGFALRLEPSELEASYLCRAQFVGPARLTLNAWEPAALQASSDNFHRKSGLLDGGMIILAMFMLITALIVRQSRYLLFAAWLLISLRVGALSAGWDMQWLGQTVPHEWLLRSRLLTVATYCVLTIALFASMFKDDLVRAGVSTVVLRALQWMCFPLLLLSATLSYKTFLPFLWVAAAVTVVSVVGMLLRLLMHARSVVAVLYSASLTITLLASLSEVLSAAFGLRELTGAINHVTAALSSALLASLAMAEQMRQEHEHRVQAQAELEHTYEAMPIGLFTLDMSGQFMSANPALLDKLGPNVLEPGRNAWGQYLDGDSFSRLLNAVHQDSQAELEVESLSPGPDGQHKRFLVRATLARNKIEGSLQDITEKYKALQELQFLANNDPLTKVYNRRGVEAMLDAALKQLAEGKPVALAYLDLDRFKLINGLYGHAAGDEVLKQICGRVTNMLTGSQQIGRVGGDEFLIVFPDTPIELAAWTCRGIIASIGNVPYKLGDKAFQVRASIGLIEIGADMSVKDMIATADRACRAAKKGHAQGLVVYDKSASVFHDHEAEFHIVERLSAPAGPLGLYLDMQPIMSLKSPLGSLNFEVLLRMRDEDGSIIPAGRVVSAAENSGRTSVIDRWVLHTTLEWIDANFARLRRTEFVCMNLSGASLNDERFVQDTIRLLEATPRAAGRLCIEITESVALHDRGNTRRFIDKVRSYGVRVALDDFGAGYTSFAYLKELPADVLKIDGSFVVNINAHPANVAIVEAIVSLARSLGMQTIAEWAEDAATVETLAEIGVDHVQGFAIARPQQPEKILTLPSAAAFIQDEHLARFVRTLGDPVYAAAQIDMIAITGGNKDLH